MLVLLCFRKYGYESDTITCQNENCLRQCAADHVLVCCVPVDISLLTVLLKKKKKLSQVKFFTRAELEAVYIQSESRFLDFSCKTFELY